MLKDFSRATALFVESSRLFEEIGDREGSGWALHHLGRMAYENGQMDQAAGYLIESLQLFDKLNDRWGSAWSLLHLAKTADDIHQTERAAVLFGAAESLMAVFQDRMSTSEREYISESFASAHLKYDSAALTSGQMLSSEKVLALILE